MPLPSPAPSATPKQSNRHAQEAQRLLKELDANAVLVIVLGGKGKSGYGVAGPIEYVRLLPDFLVHLGGRWQRDMERGSSATNGSPTPPSSGDHSAPLDTPSAVPPTNPEGTDAPAP